MYRIEDHRTVYLDMDGTIADTYSVENWEEMIKNHDASVFTKAEPASMLEVMELLDRLGSKVVILTMLPEASIYNEKDKRKYYLEVKNTKIEWLQKHFPMFTEIKFVEYRESKSSYCNSQWDVLIDDSASQLKKWKGVSINPRWAKSLDEYLLEELDRLVDLTLIESFIFDVYLLRSRDFREGDSDFDYGRGVLTEEQFHRARILACKLGILEVIL